MQQVGDEAAARRTRLPGSASWLSRFSRHTWRQSETLACRVRGGYVAIAAQPVLTARETIRRWRPIHRMCSSTCGSPRESAPAAQKDLRGHLAVTLHGQNGRQPRGGFLGRSECEVLERLLANVREGWAGSAPTRRVRKRFATRTTESVWDGRKVITAHPRFRSSGRDKRPRSSTAKAERTSRRRVQGPWQLCLVRETGSQLRPLTR